MRLFFSLLFSLILAIGVWDLFPKTPENKDKALFNQALQAQTTGDFQQAITHYLQLDNKALHSPQINYNLALCYAKTNQLGKALVYALRSENLSPHHPETQALLHDLEKKTAAHLPLSGNYFLRFARLLPSYQWLQIALLGCLIPLLALGLFSAKKNRLLYCGAAGFFLLILGNAGFFLKAKDRSHTALITAKQAPILLSPFDKAKPLLTLQEGRSLTLLNQPPHGNYYLVDYQSQRGWIKSSSLTKLFIDKKLHSFLPYLFP